MAKVTCPKCGWSGEKNELQVYCVPDYSNGRDGGYAGLCPKYDVYIDPYMYMDLLKKMVEAAK